MAMNGSPIRFCESVREIPSHPAASARLAISGTRPVSGTPCLNTSTDAITSPLTRHPSSLESNTVQLKRCSNSRQGQSRSRANPVLVTIGGSLGPRTVTSSSRRSSDDRHRRADLLGRLAHHRAARHLHRPHRRRRSATGRPTCSTTTRPATCSSSPACRSRCRWAWWRRRASRPRRSPCSASTSPTCTAAAGTPMPACPSRTVTAWPARSSTRPSAWCSATTRTSTTSTPAWTPTTSGSPSTPAPTRTACSASARPPCARPRRASPTSRASATSGSRA